MFVNHGFQPMILRAPSDDTGAAPPADTAMSVQDAVGALAAAREKKPEAAAPDPVEQAAPEPNSAVEADAAPPATESSGETEEPDPAAEPSIDPPRSWIKEHKDAFAALPRDIQQHVADSERAREADFLRRTNEAAEKAKAAEAKEHAAEQERQKYEAALPELHRLIQSTVHSEFSDIKSWDDVKAMQRDDPMRYQQWDLAQRQLNAVQAEAQAAQRRQSEEQSKAFETFKSEETKKFLEKAPEYADTAKASQLQTEARALFDDVGLSSAEFDALAAGKSGISIHDHRVQLIVRDALRFRAAQRAAKTAPAKPVPPVQRPGTAATKGERNATDIQALSQRLERTGKAEDAVALLRARRRA